MKRTESDFAELPDDVTERWLRFGQWDRVYFPKLVGLRVEAVRLDYCRMVLPFKPELEQPMGIVHGGAIATLLDAVVVPAIGSAYPTSTGFSTVDLSIQYHSALRSEDAVAHGWVVRRGKRIVFCEAEARGANSAKTIAKAILTYSVAG